MDECMQYRCEGERERNGVTDKLWVAPIYECGEEEENFLRFNNAFLRFLERPSVSYLFGDTEGALKG